MGFFEYWKAFHSVLGERTLPASAQLVGYKLLAEFNGAMFPAELELTDRELQRLTQIKSLKSIHDAKALLKQLNLIDFINRKNKPTIYRLIGVNSQTSTKETPSKHEVNTKSACLERTREDLKDEKDERQITTTATARARGTETKEPRDNYCPTNSLEVQKAWFLSEGELLKGGKAIDLLELESLYGAEKVVDAIIKARRANTKEKINYNFLKAILERGIHNDKSNVAEKVEASVYSDYAGVDSF